MQIIELEEGIINFINQFKSLHTKELEDSFLHGNCYYFAIILKRRFKGVICYLPIENHFITRINQKYYDITGEVHPKEKVYRWSDYANFDKADFDRVKKNCILW